MNSAEIFQVLENAQPANQFEVCNVLKSLFPLEKLITDEERAFIDQALFDYILSRDRKGFTDVSHEHPFLQFLGFWKGKDNGEVAALFIDTLFYFVLPKQRFFTPVFDKQVVEFQATGGPGSMSGNWKDALEKWPKSELEVN